MMLDFFSRLFDTDGFSNKFSWSTELVWLHNISDFGIGAAYIAIPFTLFYIYLKKNTPFRHIWWLFATFIVSCGGTHFMEMAATWYPAERFAGLLKFFTASISWLTVFALWRLMPAILQMKTPVELEEVVAQRTLELQIKTAELQVALEKEEKLTAVLRDREQQLMEQDKQKTNYLAMLAHELRNPLAPVRTSRHIIKEKYSHCLDDKYQELDAMMCRQLNHLSKMIDDLLDVSRITHGKIKLTMEPTQVKKCIDGAISVLESHGLLNNHNMEVDCPPEIYVLADPTRLEQILTNLLQNAIKYSEHGKRIAVRVERSGGYASIRVQDDGRGISPEAMPHIFSLFYQSEQTIERTSGGLGIGLTIVKRLVDLHGGIIETQSNLGVGTTFTIKLALVDEKPKYRPEAPQEKRDWKKHILIVEDNQDAASSLGFVFEIDGHRVTVVHDGNSAVVQANLLVPDIVILDIGLPGLNGFEVARALRSSTVTKDVKIVAVSGYSRETDIAFANEAGINQYLVKPVDIDKLKQIILDMS